MTLLCNNNRENRRTVLQMSVWQVKFNFFLWSHLSKNLLSWTSLNASPFFPFIDFTKPEAREIGWIALQFTCFFASIPILRYFSSSTNSDLAPSVCKYCAAKLWAGSVRNLYFAIFLQWRQIQQRLQTIDWWKWRVYLLNPNGCLPTFLSNLEIKSLWISSPSINNPYSQIF